MIDIHDVVEKMIFTESQQHRFFDKIIKSSYAVIDTTDHGTSLVFYNNVPIIFRYDVELIWSNQDRNHEGYGGAISLQDKIDPPQAIDFMISKHDSPEDWNVLMDSIKMVAL